MKENRTDEVRALSHIALVLTISLFSIVLITLNYLLDWEKWTVPMEAAAIFICMFMHITHKPDERIRLYIYSAILMVEMFYYCVTIEKIYDGTPVLVFALILFVMTQEKLITVAGFLMGLTGMIYHLIIVQNSTGLPMEWTGIVRTIWHLILAFFAGILAVKLLDAIRKTGENYEEQIHILEEENKGSSDFLANVSHEIRTPINAIMGLTNVCVEKETDPEIRNDLYSVNAAGRRIAEQISDILDFSEVDMRKLAINHDEYMLSSVLNDIVNEITPNKSREIELVIDVDPAIPSVMRTDVSKLKKILWHLIMNGIKYTKEGGVYVRISSIVQEYGLNLIIEVTDTGIGMDEVEQERIFDRFYQADSGRTRSTNGLGLGMAIVSGFTRSLGGFLTLESSPGEGTTVRVSIPMEVVNPAECMSLESREGLSLASFFHFDKYPVPEVREFYNAMIKNIVKGLKVSMHRVDNIDNLKKLMPNLKLTHLFVAAEEYMTDPEYMDKLAEEMLVVVVADDDFSLSEGSKARIMRKPFYCFPVVNVLNMTVHTVSDDEEIMTCPGVRALVVDDEPMNLMVAKGIFKRYEMEIVTADSGFEAVELCKKEQFDLVFMDHMMPGMDGVETMKMIRADKKAVGEDIPIVALTANAVSTAKEMFIKEGFDGFVSKPVELTELERVMRKVLPVAKVKITKVSKSAAAANAQTAVKPSETAAKEPAQEVKNDTSSQTPLGKLGIDEQQGLHYSQNDRDFYEALLLQFVKDSAGKRDVLEKSLASENLSDYAITVHALKSTAKMIGASKVSTDAKELEDAAKSGNLDFIKENHARLMEEYKALASGMQSVLGISDDALNESGSGEEDEDVLEFAPEGE